MDNMNSSKYFTLNNYFLFQGYTTVFVKKKIQIFQNINHKCYSITGCIWPPATFLGESCATVVVPPNCSTASRLQTPLGTAVLTVVTPYDMVPYPSGLSFSSAYNSATVAVLLPTFNNTCSDRYMVRLLTLIFGSGVWSTCSNELHMVLNRGISKIAVIFRAAVQFVVRGTMS